MGVLTSEIAARNRKSLATFHRTLKSQCSIAFSCFGNRAISGLRDGHRNRKSQKSLRFRCPKPKSLPQTLFYKVLQRFGAELSETACMALIRLLHAHCSEGGWGRASAREESQKRASILAALFGRDSFLSGPLWLRVQSRSRTRLRIAASIAFLFRACFKGVLDTIAPPSRG